MQTGGHNLFDECLLFTEMSKLFNFVNRLLITLINCFFSRKMKFDWTK